LRQKVLSGKAKQAVFDLCCCEPDSLSCHPRQTVLKIKN
jgi:hypothetical protein